MWCVKSTVALLLRTPPPDRAVSPKAAGIRLDMDSAGGNSLTFRRSALRLRINTPPGGSGLAVLPPADAREPFILLLAASLGRQGEPGAIIGQQMTIKDDLHALIDDVDETDAREALAFLRARLELDPRVSQAYIAECEAAYEEAHAPAYHSDGVVFRARLTAELGGIAAEQLVFGETSTASKDDIDKATWLAHHMVERYGINEHLGAVDLAHGSATSSDATAHIIDREIRRLLDAARAEAADIVAAHRAPLDRVALALLDRETLDGERFERVIQGAPRAAYIPGIREML